MKLVTACGEWRDGLSLMIFNPRNHLDLAVERGVNFFDTAWGYGEGHSEKLLGELVKRHPNEKIYTASKIPPKNFSWPAKPEFTLNQSYPYNHIIEYTDKTLKNLRLEQIDLMQFHTWNDGWANK